MEVFGCILSYKLIKLDNKNEKSKYFLEFECNTLKSEKAGLTVYLIENENNYILSIHSTNGFNNIVEYYSE